MLMGKGIHENVNNSDSCRTFNALRIAMPIQESINYHEKRLKSGFEVKSLSFSTLRVPSNK